MINITKKVKTKLGSHSLYLNKNMPMLIPLISKALVIHRLFQIYTLVAMSP